MKQLFTNLKKIIQLLETLLKDPNGKFRRVILVEYPRRGMWAIAFVTGTINNEIQSHLARSSLSIFMPTTPNPTTGWYAIVPEDEVVNLSMSIEDAFKVIISGGIVAPSTPMPPLVLPKERKLEPPLKEELSPQHQTPNTRLLCKPVELLVNWLF